MNKKQIQSLACWILNSISGGVIAYTAAKSPAAQSVAAYVSQLLTGPDTVAAVVLGITWLWGHLTHATSAAPVSLAKPSVLPKPPIVLLLLGLAFLSGCATGPESAVYQGAGVAQVSVETALQAYDQFAAAGKTTPAQNAAVKAAYEKYQLAFAAACDAGAIYAAAGNGTNAPAASLALEQALQNSNQEISDFVALVQSFGVKL